MSYFHLTARERAQVNALIREHGESEYAILRRLLSMGFERLDAGEKLFGTAPVAPIEVVSKRLDNRLNLILQMLHYARARDFNMSLELLEHTSWLRILGEHLQLGELDQVLERVKKGARLLFKDYHLPPIEAKAAK